LLSSSTDIGASSSSPGQLALLYQAYTMSMMPPEGVRRIARTLIHRTS
jgi:hypothetical protein